VGTPADARLVPEFGVVCGADISFFFNVFMGMCVRASACVFRLCMSGVAVIDAKNVTLLTVYVYTMYNLRVQPAIYLHTEITKHYRHENTKIRRPSEL